MKLPTLATATPKGKRAIHTNRYGNVNGYVGGRFWVTFGSEYSYGVEERAEAWLAGKEEETE